MTYLPRNEFERCWPWLEQAAATYGTHGKEDVWETIAAGRSDFWPMSDAAMVVQRRRCPSGLVEANVWLAGGNLETMMFWEPCMEAWARNRGVHRAVMHGREGFKRVLAPHGWRVLGVQLAKDLTDGR